MNKLAWRCRLIFLYATGDNACPNAVIYCKKAVLYCDKIGKGSSSRHSYQSCRETLGCLNTKSKSCPPQSHQGSIYR